MPKTISYVGSLIASFVAVSLCFVGSTVYSQLQAKSIDELSQSLVRDAMLSIEHLAAARAEIRHLQVLLPYYVDAASTERPASLKGILQSQKKVDEELHAFLRLPVNPAEAQLWGEIRQALSDVDSTISTMRVFTEERDFEHARTSLKGVNSACDIAVAAILKDVEFNAHNGEALALRIGLVRQRSLVVAVLTTVVSVLMTVLIARLALRAVSSYTDVLNEHNRLFARRTEELEQFAGRVAHDIRNPVGAAALSFELLRLLGNDNGKIAQAADRGLTSLTRATRILDALLDFARSGARPARKARADVRKLVTGVTEEFEPRANAARVELYVEKLPPCAVACDPGILEVLVSNLLGNAIKYIGDGPERIVKLQAFGRGEVVRIEVSDTGIGVPDALRLAIFQPFVRAVPIGEGVGLGLATVKRICESHGGRVGLESVKGGGSCFWFELPKAPDQPSVTMAA